MRFHPNKCQVLHVSKRRKRLVKKYKLHWHVPKEADRTSDASWDTHVSSITTKANRTLGLFQRRLKINSMSVTKRVYKAFIRLILEYSCSIWDP